MTVSSNSSNFLAQTNPHSHQNQNSTFEGFDFLRAVFAVSIVALHCYAFFPGSLKIGTISIGDILRANVAYLAVPAFFQISLFLFYIKSEKVGPLYLFQKRLPKLTSLYVFWVGLLIVFNMLLNGKLESLQHSVSSIKALIEFIVSGGNSPLYFFFSLAFITVLAEAVVISLGRIRKGVLKNSILYSLLVISCLLLVVFSFLRSPQASLLQEPGLVESLSDFSQWDYNPLNFLPYIFVTAITVREYKLGLLREGNSKMRLKLLILTVLFLALTILEWFFSQDLLHYSRLSLVFGSWILLYLALLSTRTVPKIIRFISGCSLGIYTLHLFFTNGLFENPIFSAFNPASQSSLNLVILFQFGVTLLGSISLTMLFRRVKFLKGFV
ncbi:acyltransferase [filamentous cyanobacterium CCT1]|nr:acyltransferase [filamentous cyanobacterium CCT1]PSN81107.1 acyltransferase [filamentous cyanobacterium CCP4]